MGVTGGAWRVQNVASCIDVPQCSRLVSFLGVGGWDAVKTGVVVDVLR